MRYGLLAPLKLFVYTSQNSYTIYSMLLQLTGSKFVLFHLEVLLISLTPDLLHNFQRRQPFCICGFRFPRTRLVCSSAHAHVGE